MGETTETTTNPLAELTALVREIRDVLTGPTAGKARKRIADAVPIRPHTKASIAAAVGLYFRERGAAYNGLQRSLQKTPGDPRLTGQAFTLFSSRAIARAIGCGSHGRVSKSDAWREHVKPLGLLNRPKGNHWKKRGLDIADEQAGYRAYRQEQQNDTSFVDRRPVKPEPEKAPAAEPMESYHAGDDDDADEADDVPVSRDVELARLVAEQRTDNRARKIGTKMQ